jgi:ArsR family transcriptional regulator
MESPAYHPETDAELLRCADMLAAMGNESRLGVMRLLLAAHPEGLVVGEIQAALGIPGSTLSHHLERLRRERLVEVRRKRQYLWYSANAGSLGKLLRFLYAECCSRNQAVEPARVVTCAPGSGKETMA